MEPEEKQLLERAVALSEQNNEILRGMRRSARWSFAWKIFYWIVILAISYGAYVYLQPYVDQLMKTYKAVTGTVNKLSLPKNF